MAARSKRRGEAFLYPPPRPPQVTEPYRYTSLRDYLRVLRQQRIVIALITIMAAGAAYGLSARQTPIYSAQASLSIQDESQNLNQLGTSAAPVVAPLVLTASVGQTITRPEILDRVRQDRKSSSAEPIDASHLSTSVDNNSGLLQLSAKAGTAVEAAALANAFATEATKVVNQAQNLRFATAEKKLRARIKGLGKAAKDPTTKVLFADQLSRLESLRAVAQEAQVEKQAFIPSTPISPRPVRNGALGALLGLVLGLVLAFARDSLDRRLRSASEVESELGMPVLSVMADDQLGHSPVLHGNATVDDLLSPQSLEAIRILRSNIEFLDPKSPPRSIVITSPLPQEGKSTVAAALAFLFAAAGKRTVLLECDLRRPVLAERLSLAPSPGLTDVLMDHASLRDTMQQVPLAGHPLLGSGNGASVDAPKVLTCITAGTPSARPAELLGSRRMGSIVDEVGALFEVVVLDTSPLLPVTDTLEVIPHVEAVVLCIRAYQTTRDQAKAARLALENRPGRPTGLVVTGMRRSDQGNYGYYAYGYGYASSPATAPPAARPPTVSATTTAESPALPASSLPRRRLRIPRWAAAVGGVLLLAVVGAVVIGVLANGGSSTNPGSHSPGGVHVLRTPFVLDGARWAVFENPRRPWTAFTRFQPPPPGTRWELVEVLTHNLGRSGFDPRVLPYRLQDGGGSSYQPDARRGTGAALNRQPHPIGSTYLTESQLAFLIPNGASGLRLIFPTRSRGGTTVQVALLGG